MHGILAAHADQLLPRSLATLYRCVPRGIVWTYLNTSKAMILQFFISGVVAHHTSIALIYSHWADICQPCFGYNK